ncbi:hypothetical protein H671_7g18744 [Cricetulus griseus]|nr:hypothetical protein H671_7g18744 [Cricetulus griseus]
MEACKRQWLKTQKAEESVGTSETGGVKYKFVYMVDYIDGFSYAELSLHPWHEAYLIVVDDFSDVFLDSICQYFIENYCINVHEGY